MSIKGYTLKKIIRKINKITYNCCFKLTIDTQTTFDTQTFS